MKPLRILPLLVGSLLFLGACSSPAPHTPTQVGTTLGNNRILSPQDVQPLFSNEHWHFLKSLPYDGYVIIQGVVDKDGQVRHQSIAFSHPDASRNERAMEYAQKAKVSAITVGSRVPPSAEIHVVFYEQGQKPRFALVFSRQPETTANTAAAKGDTLYLQSHFY